MSPTCYSPVRHSHTEASFCNPVRLACLRRAASVRSEPGSNSPWCIHKTRRSNDFHLSLSLQCYLKELAIQYSSIVDTIVSSYQTAIYVSFWQLTGSWIIHYSLCSFISFRSTDISVSRTCLHFVRIFYLSKKFHYLSFPIYFSKNLEKKTSFFSTKASFCHYSFTLYK